MYTINPYVPKERANTGADVSFLFNFGKLSSHSFDQTNSTSLRVNRVRGDAIVENPSINL
jgi:hypothetical protein